MNYKHFQEQVEGIVADCKRDFEALKPYMLPEHIDAAETAIESIAFFIELEEWSQCLDETINLNNALKAGWEWKQQNAKNSS